MAENTDIDFSKTVCSSPIVFKKTEKRADTFSEGNSFSLLASNSDVSSSACSLVEHEITIKEHSFSLLEDLSTDVSSKCFEVQSSTIEGKSFCIYFFCFW